MAYNAQRLTGELDPSAMGRQVSAAVDAAQAAQRKRLQDRLAQQPAANPGWVDRTRASVDAWKDNTRTAMTPDWVAQGRDAAAGMRADFANAVTPQAVTQAQDASAQIKAQAKGAVKSLAASM